MRRRGTPQRPGIHEGRESLSIEEFSSRYFGSSPAQARAAQDFRRHLEATTGLDLSGLSPDDCLGDVLEGTALLKSLTGAPKGRARQEGALVADLVQNALAVYLVLGPEISWDPETLPTRSMRAVINKIAESK